MGDVEILAPLLSVYINEIVNMNVRILFTYVSSYCCECKEIIIIQTFLHLAFWNHKERYSHKLYRCFVLNNLFLKSNIKNMHI